MNILHIGSAGVKKGGVSNYIISILKGLLGEDFINYYATDTNESKMNGSILINYKPQYNLFNILCKIKFLYNVYKNYNIDIVHVHTQRTALVVILSLIFNNKVKIIYTPHGFRFLQVDNILKILFHKLIDYIIIYNVNIVTVITDEELKYFKKFNNKFIKVKSVINFPLPDKMSVSKIDQIISVGTLDDRKNPFFFIKLAEIFSDKKFIWVGDGPLLNKALEYTENNKINNVQFVGRKCQKTISNLLNESMFFIITSKSEGFPLSILEAYKSKCIVISNDFIGSGEIVDNMKTGYVYSNNNISSAKQVLNCAFNSDKKIKSEMIKNSEYFLKPYLDEDRFQKDYLSIYNSIK